METKFLIFVVFATVGRQAPALGSSRCCVVSPGIRANLATIQFAKDTAHHEYTRLLDLVFTQMRSMLNQAAFGNDSEAEAASLRAEIARTESINAMKLGIIPSLEAIRIFQPDVAMTTIRDKAYCLIESYMTDIHHAINLAQCKNSTEFETEMEDIKERVQFTIFNYVEEYFDAIRCGTVQIPLKITPIIDCVQEKAMPTLLAGYQTIFEAIKILQAQLSSGTEDGNENCLSSINAHHKRALLLMETQVTDKYALLENLVKGSFFDEIGTVAGLFALQCDHPLTFPRVVPGGDVSISDN